MNKKTLTIILTVLAAAIAAALEVLTSCTTSTIFQRRTPADSVYYQRNMSISPSKSHAYVSTYQNFFYTKNL